MSNDTLSKAEYFLSSSDHLLAELGRIDLLIRAHVGRARAVDDSYDNFRGLYISDAEVDRLLQEPVGLGGWAKEGATATMLPDDARLALDQLQEAIERRKAGSAKRGITLRLEALVEHFGLTAFDRDALLISLAREIDLRYERLFAYLQDDVTKKCPSVDLVLNLLCASPQTKLTERCRFGADAPLLRHGLVSLFANPPHDPAPLLGRFLGIDERLVGYLLGDDAIDSRLQPYSRCIVPKAKLQDLQLAADFRSGLQFLTRSSDARRGELLVFLEGPRGAGRQTLAEALCGELGKRLLAVDTRGILKADTLQLLVGVRLALREARLQDAVPLFTNFDVALGDEHQRLDATTVREIQQFAGLVLFSCDNAWKATDAFASQRFLRLPVPRLDFSQRLQMWRNVLGTEVPCASGVDPAEMAGKFQITPGQIVDAARTAQNFAFWRHPVRIEVTLADLYAACNLHANAGLATLAQKVATRRGWDDIVLPRDAKEQLREICNWVEHRHIVLEQWGFDRKLSLGHGASVLFAGPSGTGKTMAAEIVAGELGLELYKIDLSSVISKYIGETEKNLARIFAEAETSNAMLFFDEADALFGKRSEIKDSHDRYANIETGFLLQKIDEYSGISILATNLRRNMDDAFVRRMAFAIDFPFPEEAERRHIWRKVWPPEAPLAADVDLDFMARQFKLAGGNIKNIALAAAFLAAGDGQTVAMAHLIRATKREIEKTGRVCVAADFGPYYEWLHEAVADGSSC